MNMRSGSFLGVSVSDRSIVCAEVSVTGGKRSVRRLGTFTLPEEITLDKPAPAGEAFVSFLRQNKFSASRAVIGIPAKWMIALEKELPPAAEEQARGMLRLAAERLGVSDNGEMVFDYAGKNDSSRANKVLLVGVKRQRIEQLEQMFDAAGISVVAITSAALTLAGSASDSNAEAPMLVLGRQGAEMVWRHEGTPRMLKHVAVLAVNGHGPVTLGPIGSELGRTLTLNRVSGTPAAQELVIWDGIGLTGEQLTELSDRSGVKVRPGRVLSSLGLEESPGARMTLNGEDGPAVDELYAPAMSLAVAGADRGLLPLNFTNSRLTPRRARRVSKRGVWGIVAGAVVVLAVAALYVSVQMRRSELSHLQSTIQQDKEKVDQANTTIGRFNYSRGYYEARSPVLECMADLSAFFKPGERIWLTSVNLRDDDKKNDKGQIVRRGLLQGHASNNDLVKRLVEQLKANNTKFREVGSRQLNISDAGNKSGEKNFSISFTYIATE